ncbi:rhodanese-like domain-containing protein [Deminuibacter soli]|uniref:Rhodanese-like domain-containing protein n=1 Tax=Deminuibacter soli TaxID=2291815 RepID=A0A3E1NNS7_9BACT|nr:rhodanese-like domain-containing protein [Deminuibacter soli]RFM29448.1 rhodanese-like domain-containing protein [Deminuibacter soli]
MKQINAQELKNMLAQQQPVMLIDVREPFEHETFNIGGKLIPLGDVLQQSAEIPFDQPVIVYCQKGVRSQLAIQRLEEKFGYTNLINLSGGVSEW